MDQVFIARQPIFDRKGAVFGYELLFRSGFNNYFDHHDQNQAAYRVIADSAIHFGLEALVGEQKAFINLTRDTLMKDYSSLLPPTNTVLEILETVEVDEQVLAAARRLKGLGYTLALDDFVPSPDMEPLVELVDILKIDFLTTSPESRQMLPAIYKAEGKILLAEKVETQEEFQEALDLDYDLFQGYFFSKPVILTRRTPVANKITYLEMLKEIHRPGMNYRDIEEVIRRDMTLSYKLLRYINSAFFGLKTEIRSIRHALVLMGEHEIKKWATLLSLSSMGEDKPRELIMQSAMRGRMCELLAEASGMADEAQDFFLLGLFSMIDALMDRNLAELLREMPLAREMKGALMRVAPNKYRVILEIVLAYEQGLWDDVSKWVGKSKVHESVVPPLYMKAVDWAKELAEAADSDRDL